MLTCDSDKAERLVTSTSGKPDAAVGRKMRVRKVRELAEDHRIRRRLFEISLLQVRNALDMLAATPSSAPLDRGTSVALTARLLDALRSPKGAEGELLTSRVEYRMARPDLYRELELTAP